MQFEIGYVTVICRIVTFPDDCRLVASCRQVTIEAVKRSIQSAIAIPAYMKVICVKGNVTDLGIWFYPVNTFALLGPERIRVSQ